MYYDYAEKFWANALKSLVHGGFKQEYTVPEQVLRQRLEAGKYKGRKAGSAYVQDFENSRDLSRLWGDEEECNLMTIVNRAFQEFSFSDQTMEKVASILAHETIITQFKEIDAEALAPALWSEDDITMVDVDDEFEPAEDDEFFGGELGSDSSGARKATGAHACEDAARNPQSTQNPRAGRDPQATQNPRVGRDPQAARNARAGRDSARNPERGPERAGASPEERRARREWTPRAIYDYLDEEIVGQEEAKRAASMLLYNHLHRKARNLAIAGPTGSGKTEIWRVLAKRFDCIRIVDASSLGPSGWKAAMHVADIFEGLSSREAENLLIVWDEFDKACEPAISSRGTDFARLLQSELLRLLDGDTVEFRPESRDAEMVRVNCRNISNVFAGSFEDMLRHKNRASGSIGFGAELKQKTGYAECLPEDLVKYGNVRQEIAGRIMQVVTMTPLTKEDYLMVLSNPKVSPLTAAACGERFRVVMDEETRQRLAERAVASGMGARYLRSEVQRRLDAQIFENPEATEMDLSDAKMKRFAM